MPGSKKSAKQLSLHGMKPEDALRKATHAAAQAREEGKEEGLGRGE